MSAARPALAAVAALATAFTLVACDGRYDPLACTLEARAGITVDLSDETGESLPADDAVGRAVEGDRVLTLEPFFAQLVGAWEAPGVYTVTVEKPGFATWVRADVSVEDGGCHVVPVRLEAVLSPSP
ncbi:MAG TPA: carboxypeptidase-like regulatory domain-containing protein [Gemmatimonadota bacterium]|nr:carboxypeptidase-like regulatory domain-containing protein [Gemmatimonadota bacterium]